MKKSKVDSHLYQLTLEKMVIGLEEPILIKGIGEIIAKVDSGNAGYNVIHGEDLTVQGDILTFKTQNKDGKDRRVSKKIKEKLNVNIGGGHIQERPVIELDVQIGGQDYKKILFSVTDRSSNDNKVLISADFVGKELDALIDVTKKKIADDNVEVDYVTESLWDGIKKTAGAVSSAASAVGSAVGSAASAVKKGAQKTAQVAATPFKKVNNLRNKVTAGLENMAQKAKDSASWVFGDPGKTELSPEIAKSIEDEIAAIKDIKKMMKEDAALIKKAVASSEKGKSLSGDVKTCEPCKILDYVGGGPDKKTSYPPGYKEKLRKALGVAKDLLASSGGIIGKITGATKKAEGLDTSQSLKKESSVIELINTLLTEEAPAPTTPNNNPQGQNSQNQNNEEKSEEEKQKENIETETSKAENPSDMNGAALQELFDELKTRNRAIFYAAPMEKDKNKNPLASGEDLWKAHNVQIDKVCQNVAAGKKYDLAAFDKVCTELSQVFTSKEELKAAGMFALCTGPLGNRKCELYVKEGQTFDSNAASEARSAADIKAIKQYNDLNKNFKQKCNELNLSFDNPDLSKVTWEKFCAFSVIEMLGSIIKVIQSVSNSAAFRASIESAGIDIQNLQQIDTNEFKPEDLARINMQQLDTLMNELSTNKGQIRYTD